ncbi:MAG: FKBP-type peptidyl-prolyl cis-trans isomerase [Proteobacteria bacterium]|nr:FKBP-type peptidyl-prolyl cis-trans isomerase [Pseudomonadota bacterium]
MAKAKYGDKVQVHYTGTLDDGTIFDSSRGNEKITFRPVEIVIGQDGDLLPKFQEAIVGLEPGQSVKVRIACEDAYGCRSEEKVYVIPRSEIRQKEELSESWRYPTGKNIPAFDPKKGDLMEISLADGNCVPVMLTEVLDTTITLDANHPLAGEDLTFDITLVNIL